MRFPFVSVVVIALAAAACGDGGGPPPPPGVISLAVGQTRTLTASQAATIEVSGGSTGGEFVLIALHGSQVAGSTVPLEFSATQTTGVTGPPSPQIGPAFDALLARAPSPDALDEATRFHARLRRIERAELTRRLAALRAAPNASTSPRYSTSAATPVPNVGDQMTLNVKLEACANADNRTGRVVAVTSRTVIVADNDNPPDGFSDADYLAIGQEFDALVYPTITQNFGTPRDIDTNEGRSVVFYTRAVNELTAAGSQSVIHGFFHPRDLFRRVGPDPNSTADDCATSNEAEMFYMLVPDPTGVVNGNRRAKDDVRRSTVGVLAHEFQHLINASHRINNNRPPEEVWLNEGLSHVAEELMFYRVSGLAPKQNITVAKLTESQAVEDAFFAYQVSNFGRLIEYLENPEGFSPYGTDDELATRGATWQLLRYAADRSTTPQQDVWMRLANSATAGVLNFTTVFGGNFVDIVRDWATAQYTDDVLSTTATFQHPSWNYRNVVTALQDPPRFPLKTRTLVAGTPLSLTLKGGSAAYLRFGVAGNTTGTITPTSNSAALPAAVSVTVVRTK